MLLSMRATAEAFGRGAVLFDHAVADFVPQHWQIHALTGPSAGHLLGLIAATRVRVLVALGEVMPASGWSTAWRRDAHAADLPTDIDPTLVVTTFRDAHARLEARWSAVTVEDLARTWEDRLPDEPAILSNALRYCAWREAIWLGEVIALRRFAGLPPLPSHVLTA